jgi:hypothetical protein
MKYNCQYFNIGVKDVGRCCRLFDAHGQEAGLPDYNVDIETMCQGLRAGYLKGFFIEDIDIHKIVGYSLWQLSWELFKVENRAADEACIYVSPAYRRRHTVAFMKYCQSWLIMNEDVHVLYATPPAYIKGFASLYIKLGFATVATKLRRIV